MKSCSINRRFAGLGFATRDALAAALAVMGCIACGLKNSGLEPPPQQLNFPISVLLSKEDSPTTAPRFLYAINSNFEARYNASSAQTIDLTRLDEAISACQANGDGDDSGTAPCTIDTADAEAGLVVSEVLTGSYVADAQLAPDGDRIYMAQRSNSNLAVIDVDPSSGALSCGSDASGRASCSNDYQRADLQAAADRSLTVPNDPTGVYVAPLSDLGGGAGDGNFVLMSHRGGDASLFVDTPGEGPVAPSLVDAIGDLAIDLQSVRMLPDSSVSWLPSSAFSTVARVGVALDAELSSPFDARLFKLTELRLIGVDTGLVNGGDMRTIRFDDRTGGSLAFILSRRPEALLVVDLQSLALGRLGIVRVIPVGFGPSRFELAQFGARTVAFVSCFDGRNVYVIDVDFGGLISVIPGMSGPFGIAVDAVRQRLYIADFTVSVLRVVSLQKLLACFGGSSNNCTPEIIATVGIPSPVRQLK